MIIVLDKGRTVCIDDDEIGETSHCKKEKVSVSEKQSSRVYIHSVGSRIGTLCFNRAFGGSFQAEETFSGFTKEKKKIDAVSIYCQWSMVYLCQVRWDLSACWDHRWHRDTCHQQVVMNRLHRIFAREDRVVWDQVDSMFLHRIEFLRERFLLVVAVAWWLLLLSFHMSLEQSVSKLLVVQKELTRPKHMFDQLGSHSDEQNLSDLCSSQSGVGILFVHYHADLFLARMTLNIRNEKNVDGFQKRRGSEMEEQGNVNTPGWLREGDRPARRQGMITVLVPSKKQYWRKYERRVSERIYDHI